MSFQYKIQNKDVVTIMGIPKSDIVWLTPNSAGFLSLSQWEK